MSLPNYGVLIGTFNRFEQEPPNNYGKWFHGFVFVNANQKIYRCAVDVNKPDGGFQYMTLDLLPSLFTQISSLQDGYHELTRDSTSGAIDYVRSPLLNQSEGCLLAIYSLIARIFGGKERKDLWIENTGETALTLLNNLVSGSSRVYVFGAPFHNVNPIEDGMHDVHMNQGDPPGNFRALDGIWQDGCVIVQLPEGALRGYFGKFVTQSLNTDDNGWPI
jgi:hypothetical protein